MNVKEIIIDNVRVVLIYSDDTTVYRNVNARFYIDNIEVKSWKDINDSCVKDALITYMYSFFNINNLVFDWKPNEN